MKFCFNRLSHGRFLHLLRFRRGLQAQLNTSSLFGLECFLFLRVIFEGGFLLFEGWRGWGGGLFRGIRLGLLFMMGVSFFFLVHKMQNIFVGFLKQNVWNFDRRNIQILNQKSGFRGEPEIVLRMKFNFFFNFILFIFLFQDDWCCIIRCRRRNRFESLIVATTGR